MKKILAFLIILLIGFIGCTKPPDPVDEESPIIASISPVPNAAAINGEQSITVLFSESMDTTTIEVSGSIIPTGKQPQISWDQQYEANDTLIIAPPIENKWADTGVSYGTLIIDGGKDLAGNYLVGIPLTYQYKVDTTPSTATLTNVPSALTNAVNLNIIVGGNDVVAYKYLLDAGPTWNWSSANEVSVSLPISNTNLADGYHTIKVIGKDSAGNWQSTSSATTKSWTIDATPPTAVLSNTPPNVTNSNSINVSVSGIDVVGYRYLLDDDKWNWSNAIEVTILTQAISRTNLSEGNHELRVIGKDNLGNWQSGDSATICQWEVNTSESIVELTNAPDYTTNSPDYNITVEGVNIISYKYSFDATPVWNNEPEININTNPAIIGTISTDGIQTIKVIGKNIYGTWQSSPTIHTWILDTIRPNNTSITANPPAATSKNSNLTWGWSNVHSTDTGTAVSYRYRLIKTGEATPIVDWTATTLLAYTRVNVLTDGEYTFSVKSVDLAGNESLSVATNVVSIDTTPPTATTNPVDSSSIDYKSQVIVITFNEAMNTSSFTLSGTLIQGLTLGSEYIASWNFGGTQLTLTLATGKAWNTGTGISLDFSGCKDLAGFSPTTGIVSYNVNTGSIKTLYIKASGGSDTNTGEINYPKSTIQSAINTLSNGGVTSNGEVRVSAGTYNVTEPITMKAGISLLGGYSASDWDDRAYLTDTDRNNATYKVALAYTGSVAGTFEEPSTVILSAGAGISSDVLVEGFTITGRSLVGSVYSAGITCRTNTSLHIQYNTINGGSNTQNSIGIKNHIASSIIENNTINGGSGSSNAYGIYNYASNVTINQNTINAGVSSRTYGIYNFSCSNTNYPTITNNSINGGGAASSFTAGIYNDIAYSVIDNNYITGTTNASIFQPKAITLYSSSPLIINNTLSGGIGGTQLLVIMCRQASSPIVVNNLMLASGGTSINAGFEIQHSSKPLIYNNTIYVTSGQGIRMGQGSAPDIRNNLLIATGTGSAIYEADANCDPQYVRNNDFYNYTRPYIDEGTTNINNLTTNVNNGDYGTDTLANWGNINTNPSVVDIDGADNNIHTPADNNWHLQASSPASVRTGAIDLSTEFTALGLPIEDRDGNPRTAGWSMGAYEQN